MLKPRHSSAETATKELARSPNDPKGTKRSAETTVSKTESTANAGGTQAISRAANLLRLIARRGSGGARLTDLSKASGLRHPTVRRILKCLINEGFVVQSATSPRYLLGPLNFELGLATRQDQSFQAVYGAVLARLAQASGDTTYLMARSGSEVVCLMRSEGHFPLQAKTFDVGGRRPLGFGAASLAMMAEMDDAEINSILDINQKDIDMNPRLTRELIWERIAWARKHGYAVTSNIYTFGIGSVGMAIKHGTGQPIYAINISIAGAERFTKKKIEQLRYLIREEIKNI
jgi:DNA-binding IclR family transcriptional regulator